MVLVTERLDSIPADDYVHEIQREEDLLHQWPNREPMHIWQKYDPITTMHLPLEYTKRDFAPPRGVFESDYIHVEYQTVNGRQPFYHRNTDVDEISYHAAGQRQVLTELGCIDLAVGEMARIPVGVAHDNRGREDCHLIFYIPNDVKENVAPVRSSQYQMPPFEGWQPATSIEFITNNNGAPGSDVSTFYTDEKLLLEKANHTEDRMLVMRSSGVDGSEWLYKSGHVWLGFTVLSSNDGKVYTRHGKAHEVQIQVKGKRWLVTQRGTLQIEPGDAVSIPLGTAFASITDEENKYITILIRYPAPAKMDSAKTAERTTADLLSKLRTDLAQTVMKSP